MDTTLILIDGYNVIRRTPALAAAERGGLAAGREALISRVVARYRGTPHRVIVVFDGQGPAETTYPLRCGVGSTQVFSASNTTADAVIGQLVEQARTDWGEHIRVVSDDWEVGRNAEIFGAQTSSANALARDLAQAPRHLHHRAQHHDYLRRREREDERERPPKGNAHKSPRRPRRG
jgi:predicted RNA-binding protein with PIN domain